MDRTTSDRRRHNTPRARRGILALALAVLVIGAGPAREEGGIPRAKDGHPDFSGIWQTLSEADYGLEAHAGRRDAPPGVGVVEGDVLPYKPEALAQKQQNFGARATDDPRLHCYVLGVPRSVYYPAPFQIFQRDRDLTLVHQFGHQVRTIHTNGTLHPKEKDQEFWLGDSRGRWEGDTLIVDVTDFNDRTWLDRAGDYHSTDLHVVEKWRFLDRDTISYTATIDDPQVYTKPWTINVLLNRRRDKNLELVEDYCFTLRYDKFYPHKAIP